MLTLWELFLLWMLWKCFRTCAELLEGLTTRILAGCLGAGLSWGFLPWSVSVVRSRMLGLVAVGLWLQRGCCSGAAGRAQAAAL